MTEKVVVYTAIMGGKDDLKEPAPHARPDGVDLVCFTDDATLRSSVFQIRHVRPETGDPRREAKRFKVLPHRYLSEYALSLWLDGSFRLTQPVGDYVRSVLRGVDMAFCRHEERDCVYEEAEESIRLGRLGTALREPLAAQVERYRGLGLPPHAGLYTGGILFRRHEAPATRLFMEAWWEEIEATTQKDQLSLGYLLWSRNPSFRALERDEVYRYVKPARHLWHEKGDNRRPRSGGGRRRLARVLRLLHSKPR